MTMRVMTLNLRFENDRDRENAWSRRRDLVIDVIRRFEPSILGTQEGTPGQLRYLRDRLTDYCMVEPPRPEDETCQYPTLFVLEKRYLLCESGEIWLSTTPGIHRSKDWDSAFPRMLSYALLEDLQNQRRLWAAVTHLDHLGLQARIEQARIIARWMISRATVPRVLLGDFNDAPGSPTHRTLTSPDVGLLDSWELAGGIEDERSMTHHDFHGVPEKFRMDWVLLSRDFQVREALVDRDHQAGRYPSDHFPYGAVLEWASTPG